MAAVSRLPQNQKERDTSLIIPKGVLNSTETAIIKIPARFQNTGPLILVKDKNVDGKYALRKTLQQIPQSILQKTGKASLCNIERNKKNDIPSNYLTNTIKEESELNRLFETCRPSHKSISFASSQQEHIYNKPPVNRRPQADVQSEGVNSAVNSNLKLLRKTLTSNNPRSGETSMFITRPICPQAVPIPISPTIHNRDKPIGYPSRIVATPRKLSQPANLTSPKNSSKHQIDYLSTEYPTNFIKRPPDYQNIHVSRLKLPPAHSVRGKYYHSVLPDSKNTAVTACDNHLDAIKEKLYGPFRQRPVNSRSVEPARSTTENLAIRSHMRYRPSNVVIKPQVIDINNSSFKSCSRLKYATVPVKIVG